MSMTDLLGSLRRLPAVDASTHAVDSIARGVALAHRANGNEASFETHRRMARSVFEQLPEPERKWCESDLAELDGGN